MDRWGWEHLDPWLKRADGNENEARRLRSEYMRSYRAKNHSGAPRLKFSQSRMDDALPVE